jgi:hypothetical protein
MILQRILPIQKKKRVPVIKKKTAKRKKVVKRKKVHAVKSKHHAIGSIEPSFRDGFFYAYTGRNNIVSISGFG